MPALHKAAERGDIVEVKRLIEDDADKEHEDGLESTALHHAAKNGHLEVVVYLVEQWYSNVRMSR